mmetsp:Transcript_87488/g.255816  ORF Transcript_87488/g.255816 Transcript_87488/m.255816 type:complete len:469 (-) Transcript_87488:334-1740(-)
MPGWARTKQQIWESLHTAPPKSYAAAQRHYETILNVGHHVDVGDLLAFLDTLMGPLKEKEDKAKSEIASAVADKLRESPGRPAGENPRNPGVVPVPKRHAHEEPGDLDPELAPLATPDSADNAEESCVAVPNVAYPAYVGDVVKRVLEALSAVPGAEVRAFGSAVSGFGDRTSDIDLVVTATKASLVKGLELEGRIARRDLAPRSLSKLHTRLQEHGFRIRECVLFAQMPILKMSIASRSSDRSGDIECDLSVNNLLPVFNTALLKAYADIDHRAVEVTQACKRWAKAQGVHGASLGHLSSYAFTLMVIFYMQVKGALPCLQYRAQEEPLIYKEEGKEYNVARADLASMAWEPAKEVAITFSGFVSFFCQEFKWGESVVSIRTGQCFSKKDYPRLRMRPREGMTPQEWGVMVHIEDPFDIERNLNSVLGPTHSEKLRLALVKQNSLVKRNKFASRPTSSRASGWETSS